MQRFIGGDHSPMKIITTPSSAESSTVSTVIACIPGQQLSDITDGDYFSSNEDLQNLSQLKPKGPQNRTTNGSIPAQSNKTSSDAQALSSGSSTLLMAMTSAPMKIAEPRSTKSLACVSGSSISLSSPRVSYDIDSFKSSNRSIDSYQWRGIKLLPQSTHTCLQPRSSNSLLI